MNISLFAGWLLDLLLGDPARLPHPVVWFGRWIAFCERHLNHGAHRMLKGALTALFSTTATFATAYALMHVISPDTAVLPLLRDAQPSILPTTLSHWLFTLAEAIIIFYCLAGHTLRREVRLVFEAVDRSLDEGRQQVARIVGRDTAALSAQEVRTAALETLAENLSDGVVAPLFWYALLGVPGMLAYKMVNTLDSMIGYHSPRYRQFGCWAARIDDVFNYLPARLTALLMLVCHPRKFAAHLRFVLHFGPQHASPNSGWPEASLAAILDCCFGGPHDYFGEVFDKPFIGRNRRAITTSDMRLSIRVCLLAECLAVAAIAFV